MSNRKERRELAQKAFSLSGEDFREIVSQAFEEERITEGELYNIAELEEIGIILYEQVCEMLRNLPGKLTNELKAQIISQSKESKKYRVNVRI